MGGKLVPIDSLIVVSVHLAKKSGDRVCKGIAVVMV